MRSWIFSLQFRLVVGFALVLALALLGVSWYVSAESERQADRIRRIRDEVREDRIEQIVSNFFGERHGWANVQPTLEQAGLLYDAQIVLRDVRGRVVGDSHFNVGAPPSGLSYRAFSVQSGGEPVGSIEFAPNRPLRPDARLEPAPSQLAASVNDSLLWTGLAAGVGGILLIGILSRRVLAPVHRLSAAAERLGRGDLTQRVESTSRDEIGELGRTFNGMAQRLEEAEAQRRALVADVAHELRTPLSNIQGYVEAIRDGVVEASDSVYETLHQQVQHLAHLVEDLRLLALAEAGALRLHFQPEQMADVLTFTTNAFQPRAETKGVALLIETPDGLPLARMDRSRVDQVLHNLVDNAIFHTPEGGRITVSVETTGDAIRVRVADTGPGMTADEVARIFDRFYRADPSRARSTGGAGLGLTIAKQLIEVQGGRIWAESEPGAGSVLSFELPLAVSNQPGREDEG